jgi:hypothetical protein
MHSGGTPIERVLELARWAPSGDNTQPWRFELIDETRCVLHTFDTRQWCVYDLQGHASQLAVGALLETIALAASGEGFRAAFARRPGSPDGAPVIDVELVAQPGVSPDPLRDQIRRRTTQRRPLCRRPLTAEIKQRLEQSLPLRYTVRWIDSTRDKRRMAGLLFRNAHIRLTIPEAYRVHRDIIKWNAQFSEDRIPDQAVGLDVLTLRLMRWAMASWERVNFLNKHLAGTFLPRLQLDYLPALKCAAHFALFAEREPKTIDDFHAGGRALQRLWLTATDADLQFQPELTPVIFADYARREIRFTAIGRALEEAQGLRRELEQLLGGPTARLMFAGRVGYGRPPVSRSLRLPLSRLLKD